jgi:hypothetical protein
MAKSVELAKNLIWSPKEIVDIRASVGFDELFSVTHKNHQQSIGQWLGVNQFGE